MFFHFPPQMGYPGAFPQDWPGGKTPLNMQGAIKAVGILKAGLKDTISGKTVIADPGIMPRADVVASPMIQRPMELGQINIIEEIKKSQPIRMLDVGLFGPMMIYSAMNRKPPEWMRLGLLLIGVGTILYNGMNFFKNLENLRAVQKSNTDITK